MGIEISIVVRKILIVDLKITIHLQLFLINLRRPSYFPELISQSYSVTITKVIQF